MGWKLLAVTVTGAVALAGCQSGDETNQSANAAETNGAAAANVDQTIAAGLDQNSRFFQAAKAAGLDATLAGPGPYTVLVPSDQAFAALPPDALGDPTQPANRAELTRVLTYHILPGTVLIEDISRAIDNSDGNAVLATMGGETLRAARDGDVIVLTDGAGTKARITQGDIRRTNGVVHNIDTVLMPREGEAPAEAQAQQNAAQ